MLLGYPPYLIEPGQSPDQRPAYVYIQQGNAGALIREWQIDRKLSAEACDLLTQMLAPEAQRITTEQLRNHRWALSTPGFAAETQAGAVTDAKTVAAEAKEKKQVTGLLFPNFLASRQMSIDDYNAIASQEERDGVLAAYHQAASRQAQVERDGVLAQAVEAQAETSKTAEVKYVTEDDGVDQSQGPGVNIPPMNSSQPMRDESDTDGDGMDFG
jgi:hypothetical protein